MVTYRDLYPLSLSMGNGLFSQMSTDIPEVPWSTLSPSAIQSLEVALNIHSGFKTVTPTFKSISEESRATMVFNYFKDKWIKLWNVYAVEYNILDAYIVNETGSDQKTNNRSRNMSHGHVVAEEGTNTGTIDTSNTLNSNTDDFVFAFNSNSQSPSGKSVSTDSGDNLETRNLENSHTTTHSGQDTESNNDSESGSYTIKKTGNIGYSTPQKMLSEEMILWKEPYFRQVFNDIVNFTMYQVY